MMDDATNEPINICVVCKNEVIGWVDNPEADFVCEDCYIEING